MDGWSYLAVERRIQTDVDASMVVVEDSDAWCLDDRKQEALLTDVQLLGAERPAPRLFQDPTVDAELEVGVDVDVECWVLDLDAADTAYVGARLTLCNRVENGDVILVTACWHQTTMIRLWTTQQHTRTRGA